MTSRNVKGQVRQEMYYVIRGCKYLKSNHIISVFDDQVIFWTKLANRVIIKVEWICEFWYAHVSCIVLLNYWIFLTKNDPIKYECNITDVLKFFCECKQFILVHVLEKTMLVYASQAKSVNYLKQLRFPVTNWQFCTCMYMYMIAIPNLNP